MDNKDKGTNKKIMAYYCDDCCYCDFTRNHRIFKW